MIWKKYRHLTVRSAPGDRTRPESKVDRVDWQVQMLEDKVDALALSCQALWELVQTKTELTDSDLLDKMNEIDLRDGTADGKMSQKGTPCAKCGRILGQRRVRCMYCGEVVDNDHVFQD